MKAAILSSPDKISKHPLRIEQVPRPSIAAGQVLLRVRACGVCRTDLHIVEGELPSLRDTLVPGHQIVGEIVEGGTKDLPLGMRVGVSWVAGTDGTCSYCQHSLENLCDAATFTGYSVNGGYAEYAVARADFVFRFLMRWMICVPLHFYALALSGFAACVWPEWRKESASGYLDSAPRRISRLQFYGRGDAKCMSRPAAHLTASWRNRWAQPGWEMRPGSLQSS